MASGEALTSVQLLEMLFEQSPGGACRAWRLSHVFCGSKPLLSLSLYDIPWAYFYYISIEITQIYIHSFFSYDFLTEIKEILQQFYKIKAIRGIFFAYKVTCLLINSLLGNQGNQSNSHSL